ncbi:4-hydroxybutyrate dehydrogenase [Vibrio viridaestus]|uniref:Iron-containing alcohol dehydrogenase n=1 Tax=Vibrio viridaestus TaxID=2487322 RepID=A0A3N9TGB2_9VIBR|nr:4-hydroxybutyrate dehydrogenase [Vibrio viridaestus]RQW63307.1 iron-containing alcohol dehydrogenase [Vibrio viridaestus]
MKLIKIQPTIHKFEAFSEFATEFNLSSTDVIVVNDSIFNKFIKQLNLNSIFISPKKYGKGEPSDEIIDSVIKEAAQYQYQRVIAIGGGAVMDIAKFLVLDGISECLDVFENRTSFKKIRELIAIPTTCGTGSEVTAISVAEIKSKGTKMGTAIPEFLPDHAVMIPQLLKDMPYKVFAFSTLDALVHASESYVSPNSNAYTELFAEKAITLILQGYLTLKEKGKEYYSEIIEDFLIGSNYAGIAFGNTGVGAVHALAYPLGANYHVAHGECNYEFFTPVFKLYNEKAPEGKISQFNALIASILNVEKSDVYAVMDELFDFIWEKQKLNTFGMNESETVEFAEGVAVKQVRLLANNYVPLSVDELASVYKETY